MKKSLTGKNVSLSFWSSARARLSHKSALKNQVAYLKTSANGVSIKSRLASFLCTPVMCSTETLRVTTSFVSVMALSRLLTSASASSLPNSSNIESHSSVRHPGCHLSSHKVSPTLKVSMCGPLVASPMS